MPRIKLATRSKTLLMTMGVVVLLTTIFIILLLRLHHARIEQDIEDFHQALHRIAEQDTLLQLEFFSHRARANLASPGILEAMRDRDHDALLALTRGRFEILQRESPELAVMHFHAADGTSLLRMHHPDPWGDPIASTRPLLARVHQTHAESRTLELGRFGLFLRTIVPAFIDQTYVGALEFGVHPQAILKRVRDATGAEAILLIAPEAAQQVVSDLAPSPPSCQGIALRLCLEDTVFQLPEGFVPAPVPERVSLNGRTYILHSDIDFRDDQGQRIASLVVIQDISEHLQGFHQTVLAIISSALIALLAIVLFIRRTLGRMERELATGHARLQAMAKSMNEGMYMLDPHGKLVFINPAALDMLGYQEGELMGRDLHDLIHHHDVHGAPVPASACPINLAIDNGASLFREDDVFWHKNGQPLRVSYAASPVMINGEVVGSLAIFHDDSTRLEREEALKRELRLFQAGPVVVFTWRNAPGWPVEFVSPSVAQWGYPPEDVLNGKLPYADIVHPDDLQHVGERVQAQAAGTAERFEEQYRIRDARGRWIWIHDFTVIRRDDEGRATHFDGYMFEISDLKQAQLDAETLNARLVEQVAEVTRLSETDALTGIANRARLDRAMQAEMARIRRYGGEMDVILLDIDHFKAINDTHGHLVGDEVLKELARFVCGKLRSTDLFARWGGEEFVIMSPTGLEEARQLAERLRAGIADHGFPHGERLTCSLGVTACTPADTLSGCLTRVDQALYQAKAQGRDRIMTLAQEVPPGRTQRS